jgi:hypothetical protein
MMYVGLGFQLPSGNHHEIMVGNTYTETEGVIASVDMAKQPSGLCSIGFIRQAYSSTQQCMGKILGRIRIYHLPIEYWKSKCLAHIANGVGTRETIICSHADSLTEKLSRLGFANVCVEIEAVNALPNTISLKGPVNECP